MGELNFCSVLSLFGSDMKYFWQGRIWNEYLKQAMYESDKLQSKYETDLVDEVRIDGSLVVCRDELAILLDRPSVVGIVAAEHNIYYLKRIKLIYIYA